MSSDFRLVFVAEMVPVNPMAYLEPEKNTEVYNIDAQDDTQDFVRRWSCINTWDCNIFGQSDSPNGFEIKRKVASPLPSSLSSLSSFLSSVLSLSLSSSLISSLHRHCHASISSTLVSTPVMPRRRKKQQGAGATAEQGSIPSHIGSGADEEVGSISSH